VFRRRLPVLLLLALAGLTALTGCRTNPNVAAYVGDDRIDVQQLSAAVDQRLADPDIAAFAAGDRAAYSRQVLTLEVTERIYAAAAARLGLQVSDADVQDRITTLLGGADQDQAFRQIAQQQGASAQDVRENVRQQLVRVRAATAAGKADMSEAALQQRYAASRDQLTQVQLGLITVPDQATADAVRAQLTADPASYPAVAAQHAGQNTLPAVQAFTASKLPQVLAASIAGTPPGQVFTQAVPEAGGVVVGLVQGSVVPPFADVRDQLVQQALSDADQAGAALVGNVRSDLHITINPRFGVLGKNDQVVAANNGVVKVLQDAGNAAAGGSGD
jgi:SurA-like protein/parvulin-like peptidyl-prolyl cis-trans isomerase-like protein